MTNSGGVTIQRLLSEYRFTIPDYQRPYSWTKKEVEDYLADLQEHHQEQSSGESDYYHLGSILLRPEGERSAVVDGQQRLTTTYLLVAALHAAAHRLGQTALSNLLYSTTYDSSGDERLELHFQDQSPDTHALLESLVTQPGKEHSILATDSRYPLYKAYQLISAWVGDNLPDLESLKAFRGTVLTSVRLVVVEARSEAQAWRMFERANDRGKALSSLDLLKAELIASCGKDKASREQVVRDWRETMRSARAAGDTQENLLSYYVTADHATRKVTKAKVREQIPEDVPALEIAWTFREAASAYAKHLEGQRSDGTISVPLKNIHDYTRLARFRQSRPVLLAGRHLDSEAFDALAHAVEDLLYVLLIAGVRGQDYEKELFTWAGKIRKLVTLEDVESFVAETLRPYQAKHQDAFVTRLRDQTAKSLGPGGVRYLLGRIEQYLRTQTGSPVSRPVLEEFGSAERFEIEHILPQTPTDEWVTTFGTSLALLQHSTDRIGNLTLLPKTHNSVASNRPYEEKLALYKTSWIHLTASMAGGNHIGQKDVLTRLYQGLPTYPVWNLPALEDRTSSLVELAQAAFGFNDVVASTQRQSMPSTLVGSLPNARKPEALIATLTALAQDQTPEEMRHSIDTKVVDANTVRRYLRALSFLGLADKIDDEWALSPEGEALLSLEDTRKALAETILGNALVTEVAHATDAERRAVAERHGHQASGIDAAIGTLLQWNAWSLHEVK